MVGLTNQPALKTDLQTENTSVSSYDWVYLLHEMYSKVLSNLMNKYPSFCVFNFEYIHEM